MGKSRSWRIVGFRLANEKGIPNSIVCYTAGSSIEDRTDACAYCHMLRLHLFNSLGTHCSVLKYLIFCVRNVP